MAIYAIGDVQGCYDALMRLLERIQFDEKKDVLWFTGDLVNRGTKSLETLRFIKSLGESAVSVLGNHDIHLLVAFFDATVLKKKDSLKPILNAPDCEELLTWLRYRPLFYWNESFCLLHAGLPPQWDFQQIKAMTNQFENALRSSDYKNLLLNLYGDKPDCWSENLTEFEQLRFTVNCLTRMRFCDAQGKLDFVYNGEIGSQPANLMPWFAVPNRKSQNLKIIFGHWSALGFYNGYNCYAIDTGCVWGGTLTALKLDKSMESFSAN